MLCLQWVQITFRLELPNKCDAAVDSWIPWRSNHRRRISIVIEITQWHSYEIDEWYRKHSSAAHKWLAASNASKIVMDIQCIYSWAGNESIYTSRTIDIQLKLGHQPSSYGHNCYADHWQDFFASKNVIFSFLLLHRPIQFGIITSSVGNMFPNMELDSLSIDPIDESFHQKKIILSSTQWHFQFFSMEIVEIGQDIIGVPQLKCSSLDANDHR